MLLLHHSLTVLTLEKKLFSLILKWQFFNNYLCPLHNLYNHHHHHHHHKILSHFSLPVTISVRSCKDTQKNSLDQDIAHLICLSVMWRSRIQLTWIWPWVMTIRKTVCSTFWKVFIFGKAIFQLLSQNLVIPCVTLNYAKGYFKTLGKKKKSMQISMLDRRKFVHFSFKM